MLVGRHHLVLRVAAFAVALLAVGTGLVVAPSVALLLAPAAALLLLVAHGVFLGEDVIERLRSRRAAAPRHARAGATAAPAIPAFIRRTGRRIAFALAVRPPPVRPALQH